MFYFRVCPPILTFPFLPTPPLQKKSFIIDVHFISDGEECLLKCILKRNRDLISFSGCIESLLLRRYFAFVCNDSSVYIAKPKKLFVKPPYTTKINIFNLPAVDYLAVT